MRRRVEWAVLESRFRHTGVLKGDLGSREEAEAWKAALDLTNRRADHEHFMLTDGHTLREESFVGWRYIDGWHPGTEEPQPESA